MRPRARGGTLRFVAIAAESALPLLLSVRDVAHRLAVHPETIRRLIHDGRLDAVRVGRVLRVPSPSVQVFLADQRVRPARSS